MERAPGFIGTAGVPLVRQANISCLAEIIPRSHTSILGVEWRRGITYYGPI
jgi:hypothetical protein